MKYNIGIDIRTDGTGWSVTDEEGRLLRNKGRYMFGTSMFDEASNAQERRRYRITRRQRNRTHQRIDLLQELLEKDVLAADESFYIRLDESAKDAEDRTTANLYTQMPRNLFTDGTETVLNTAKGKRSIPIYKVREMLVKTRKKADIRWVYLAIAHILKNRGHFLDTEDAESTFQEMCYRFYGFLCYLNDRYYQNLVFDQGKIEKFIKAYKENRKKEELLEIMEEFGLVGKAKTIGNIAINLLEGESADISVITTAKKKRGIISFEALVSNTAYDRLDEETYDTLQSLQEIYEWRERLLEKQEKTEDLISEEMNLRYETHKADLKELKKWFKTYTDAKTYEKMFHSDAEDANYNAYTGSRTGETNTGDKWKGCSQEKYYRELKRIFHEQAKNDETKEKDGWKAAGRMLARMYDGDGNILPNGFLPLQRIKLNSGISNQRQMRELKAILENQGEYYTTIQENKEKIMMLGTERIPHYVGPLKQTKESPFTPWIHYTDESREPITPWNLKEKVDLAATAEAYMAQATNNCTFLRGEKVLPRHSLLYEEYTILNELNAIFVQYDEPEREGSRQGIIPGSGATGKETEKSRKDLKRSIPQNIKKRIIREVFAKQKRVSVQYLCKWLEEEAFREKRNVRLVNSKGEPVQKINAKLTAWADMERITGKPVEPGDENLEKIILWATLYGDRTIYVKRLRKEMTMFTEEQLRQFEGLQYKGWGRYSRRLLTEPFCILKGKKVSVLEVMREHHKNFMKIYYTKGIGLREQIDMANALGTGEIQYEDIAGIPCSPAIRRGMWNAVKVIGEIRKYMKCPPEYIFIRNMRESNSNKRKEQQTSNTRYAQIRIQYDNYEKETGKKVEPELRAFLQSRRGKEINDIEYLFLTQMGRCMYTGSRIDIHKPSTYEVDNIVPLYLTWDESLENRVLVQRHKRVVGMPLSRGTINCMNGTWEELCESGLISGQKLNSLRIDRYDEETKKYYLKKQTSENNLLIERLTGLLRAEDPEIKVYGINARLVDQFRKKFNTPRLRSLNDMQQAYDAFLTANIGNFIATKLRKYTEEGSLEQIRIRKNERLGKYDKNGLFFSLYSAEIEEDKKKNAKGNTLEEYLKKVYGLHNGYITKKQQEYTGKYYFETLYRPAVSAEEMTSLVTKRGSHKQAYIGHMTLISYEVMTEKKTKNKEKNEIKWTVWKEIVNIPAYIAAKGNILDYIVNELGYNPANGYYNVKILRRKVLLNQEVEIDGHPFYLKTASEWINAKQLYVREEYIQSIYTALSMPVDSPEEEIHMPDEGREAIAKTAEYLLGKLETGFNVYGKLVESIKDAMSKTRPTDTRELILMIRAMINCMNTRDERIKPIVKAMTGAENIHGENRIYNKRMRAQEITLIQSSATGLYYKKEKFI